MGMGPGFVGTLITMMPQRMVVHGLALVYGMSTCCVAVRIGSMNQSTCAPPSAAGAAQQAESAATGSELPGRLTHKSLNLYLRDFGWQSFEPITNVNF